MMANSWFKFKKFTIRQDKTAMKVGTDGVLLGAWAEVSGCRKILDVGTGTGLIALMIAQRSDADIDAIEIDQEAAEQAASNVAKSSWHDRIKVICTSFQEYCKNQNSGYDLVVCNPPFFNNSLKTNIHSRNIARHDDKLKLKELVSGTKNLLNANGHLCVIIPSETESEMISLAEKMNFHPSKILRIRPVPGKDYKRVLIDFSIIKEQLSESEMNIETGFRHQYSLEYFNLTQDYYLNY